MTRRGFENVSGNGTMPKVQFLVWKDDYSVGVEHLDSQHRQIFDTINTFYNAILDAVSSDMVANVLNSLQEYTRVHFREEERLMKLHRFPELREHEDAHAYLIYRTEYFFGQFHLHSVDLSPDLFMFLKEWWTNHIMAMDRKYAPFLRETSGPGDDTAG